MPTLIVGLGNPGGKYEATRHNAGAMAVHTFFGRHAGVFEQKWKKKFDALVAEGLIGRKKVILLLPQTFMNESGSSVIQAARFWKIKPKDMIVVYDDLDLPLGKIRIRLEGSAAGHKGLQSIIDRLGTQKIPRLRIGIAGEKRPLVPADVYVLEPFEKFGERPVMDNAYATAFQALDRILDAGIQTAMNEYN